MIARLLDLKDKLSAQDCAASGEIAQIVIIESSARNGGEVPVNFQSTIRINTAAGSNRKSTRLNSSHVSISYAVFCLKKKKNHIKKVFASRDNIVNTLTTGHQQTSMLLPSPQSVNDLSIPVATSPWRLRLSSATQRIA